MDISKGISEQNSYIYYITNQDNKCIHLHDGLNANGAALTLWDKIDHPKAHWHVRPSGERGYFHVVNQETGRAIHNHGGGKENNAPCTTWEIIDQDNLKIRLEEVGPEHPGYYYLIFKDSGKCVHNEGDRLSNGSPITQWEKLPQKNLMWRFEPVHKIVITRQPYGAEEQSEQSGEYVEIANNGEQAVDISSWSLGAEGVDKTTAFPAGTIIEPGQVIRVYLVTISPDHIVPSSKNSLMSDQKSQDPFKGWPEIAIQAYHDHQEKYKNHSPRVPFLVQFSMSELPQTFPDGGNSLSSYISYTLDPGELSDGDGPTFQLYPYRKREEKMLLAELSHILQSLGE
ncbi:RICIN domain-containing protein [Zobellella aerophila]|uniref:LTD domain-containing protein n=1 Tax=Zobellella aerophila TaxID=870480 RepID=A0ABP6VPH9_9GAMM